MLRNALLLLAATAGLHAAATIFIVNNDAAGEGFNDPTAVTPIGGNTGTTLGEQRLIAFQHAASLWGATLTSSQTILVRANFDPLTCTATSAVLGSAGPLTVHAAFGGAPLPTPWYHAALANKLAGADLDTANPDIAARFNSNLNGSTTCLNGTGWYLGLDANHGANIDLVTVVLHELGHGVGFSTTTSGANGVLLGGRNSVFDHFLRDNTTSKTWDTMTDAERVASAINTGNLVWTGNTTVSEAAQVLGRAEAVVTSTGVPVNVAGTYVGNHAAFGAGLTTSGVTGHLMPIVEQSVGGGSACAPFNASNTLAANGNIAVIDRGVCTFVTKVKNAQNAGAIGVLFVNNTTTAPSLASNDPTITIPTLVVSSTDGAILKTALRYRSRSRSGVIATLRTNMSILTGVDASNRPRMFAPNPIQQGSSVSHFDNVAFRNLLMEPAINADLTHVLIPPRDLTFSLLRDIGW